VSRRDWRRDNGRLEGPYGIPAQYLTDAEKARIDRPFQGRFSIASRTQRQPTGQRGHEYR
jgi:hypothetical protein